VDAVIRGLFLAFALCASPLAWSQTETQIKAAFLYKFGGFVEWPQAALGQPEGTFTIGVMGADPLAIELEQVVAGRSVHGRKVAVRKLRRGDSFAGLHVLFVGRAEAARLAEIAAGTKGQPLLLVTDSDNSLSQGSMINFVAVEDKVRFDVALPAVERGQLRISARLLAVARKVLSG
jgi:hypothetical protein